MDEQDDIRQRLAALYNIIGHFGWSDFLGNHLSARVSGTDDQFLLGRFGLLFEEMTAHQLVKVDYDGNVHDQSKSDVNVTGFIIHSELLKARPDVGCIIHTHSPNGRAVSILEGELLLENQESIFLRNKIAYCEYQGPEVDKKAVMHLVNALGDKKMMIMRNHGLLVTGSTIAEAYWHYYYLEQACDIHLKAMAAGGNIHHVPEVMKDIAQTRVAELLEGTLGMTDQQIDVYELAFQAVMRQVKRLKSQH